MANATYILRVRGIPDSPMVHPESSVLILGFPHCIHENVNCALGRLLGFSIQHRHSENDSPALFACTLILPQYSLFALIFGLTVEIRRLGSAIRFVRRIALCAGEHIVRRDINEEYVPRSTYLCERGRSCNIQSSSAFGIAIAFIWEPVCSAWKKQH